MIKSISKIIELLTTIVESGSTVIVLLATMSYLVSTIIELVPVMIKDLEDDQFSPTEIKFVSLVIGLTSTMIELICNSRAYAAVNDSLCAIQ